MTRCHTIPRAGLSTSCLKISTSRYNFMCVCVSSDLQNSNGDAVTSTPESDSTHGIIYSALEANVNCLTNPLTWAVFHSRECILGSTLISSSIATRLSRLICPTMLWVDRTLLTGQPYQLTITCNCFVFTRGFLLNSTFNGIYGKPKPNHKQNLDKI